MPITYDQATYHLRYEVKDEQPVISVHTDLENLTSLRTLDEGLGHLQEDLGISQPFTYEDDAFGYEGVGTIDDSAYVAGWGALRLALPKSNMDGRYLGSPTSLVLPLVTTMSVVLSHLKQASEGTTDPDSPQLVIASLSNRLPLNDQYSAPLRATITPAALECLANLSDIDANEEHVRQALYASFQYPYGHAREDEFRVKLGEDISFDYPGDGTGFFASRRRDVKSGGITLNAANNDYPIQQVGLMGGLAALNGLLIDASKR